MKLSQPAIPISVFEFEFQAQEDLRDANLMNLWHGTFGNSLKALACVQPDQSCANCMLLHNCVYPYLFRRVGSPVSEMMRGQRVPIPHVIRILDANHGRLNRGDTHRVGLHVVGDAGRHVDTIIRAFYNAGEAGLGKSRSRMKLMDVLQRQPDGELIDSYKQSGNLPHFPPSIPQTPNPNKSIELVFSTPYKPSGKGPHRELDVAKLLMAVIRRVSLLQYFYTNKPLKTDFSQLKTLTDQVIVQDQSLQWQHGERYSGTHRAVIDMSGWLGRLTIELDPSEALWPYLWLGRWLGVGKFCSAGMGGYQIN